ncbi:MAG: GNAT family N-acetyltransferase [Bdellovibrionota bacterium]
MTEAVLIVRNAQKKDVKQIQKLCALVYPWGKPYSLDVLRAQIENFSEGQFVAEAQGRIVGYCASIIVNEDLALRPHTWREITGGGYGSTHTPTGEYLYGIEIFIDPKMRGKRIGDRFYRKRKELCRQLRLKGIVFGGRLPGLSKKIKKVGSVEKYLESIRNGSIRDAVIGFQLRQGFKVIGILKNYLNDPESLGYAAHLFWENPEITSSISETAGSNKTAKKKHLEGTIRLATVQYMQRGIKYFEEFEQIVTYFVDVVADYRSDFVLFPELFTLQLLSIENEALRPEKAILKLTEYTAQIKELFSRLAIKFNINIIAGSHPTKQGDKVLNISYVFLRDGSIHEQAKIHPTPNERYWWNIEGGDSLSVIDTDWGPIGVLICYDSEFPELARHLVDQGAKMIFVPFCTDERQSYLRVRYCSQARAVENQIFMILSGNVGNLPRVHNMDIQYAQSCILTPCDFSFSRDGIAADTTPNVETVAFADLRVENLNYARNQGTVRNLRDRRHDLYGVVWHNKLLEK